jgi:hypothetical protein
MISKWPHICFVLALCSCTSYQYSNKTDNETVTMKSIDFDDPLTSKSIVSINNPVLSSRSVISTDMLVQGANLAIQGVKYLIDESKNKYIAEYVRSINNENFYASNSKNGLLDPEGIQFKGFTFERNFKEKKGEPLKAIYVAISLDETKLEDIYFNSKFYFKLDNIDIDYAKVKLNANKWYLPWTWFLKKQTTFNLDLEIAINANWIDEQGVIHSNIPFGQFFLPLRDIPVNPNDAERSNYFNKLKNTAIAGSSYLIPRSVTFCRNTKGKIDPCFGTGDFSNTVNARESSKEGFVNKLIQDNANDIMKSIKPSDLKKILK